MGKLTHVPQHQQVRGETSTFEKSPPQTQWVSLAGHYAKPKCKKLVPCHVLARLADAVRGVLYPALYRQGYRICQIYTHICGQISVFSRAGSEIETTKAQTGLPATDLLASVACLLRI
eukprot:scaffold47646_cov66-Phaeocystis_antarctica.AAC.2